MALRVSLLCCLLILFANNAFALRCGRQLVNIGDYKQDVLDICGEPESVETHVERRGRSDFIRGNNRKSQSGGNNFSYGQQQYIEIDVIVDEWIYDFGPRRLQQYLRFENGKLKEIKNLGRGD